MKSEVGMISAEELKLNEKLWSLPKERTKNGRPHDVALVDGAGVDNVVAIGRGRAS